MVVNLLLIDITNDIRTEMLSTVGVQADAPQELTSPTHTTLFQTPAMGFGEVGKTAESTLAGYSSDAHSVAEFDKTEMLERMILLLDTPWATTDTLGELVTVDVQSALLGATRNADAMTWFHYFRSDIEITVRLVTNQFYYGALMVTLYPLDIAGITLEARAVQDPSIISASSDEAVVKEWKYCWPYAWFPVEGFSGVFPVNLTLDVLAPLKAAKADMPSSVRVQIWGRWKNLKLAYPYGFDDLQAQSKVRVKYPVKKKSPHPADENSVDKALNAIRSVTIGDAATAVTAVAEGIVENWGSVVGPLAFLADKPDRVKSQIPINEEPNQDLFTSDVEDTNVSLSLYKARYLDPSLSRMPMTKSWTVSDYARIPGMRDPFMFDTVGDSQVITLIGCGNSALRMRTPLDYAYTTSSYWRGSIKLMLQFFTSSFITCRVVVQYINNLEYPNEYPSDYYNGITKVINVKGDTVDTITLPWLSNQWWNETLPQSGAPCVQIKAITPVISTDTTVDPVIYCVPWVAGGEDIQFAFPKIPIAANWIDTSAELEAQTSPGRVFQRTFPPIVPSCSYDVDNGFCTSEMLGPITDICKRYSRILPESGGETYQFLSSLLDYNYYTWRRTHFGTWRCAFLFRSGGLRWRGMTPQGITPLTYTFQTDVTRVAPDGIVRVTEPAVASYPYGMLDNLSVLTLTAAKTGGTPVTSSSWDQFLAARDDVQLGWPILPPGIPTSAPDDVKFGQTINDWVSLPVKDKQLDTASVCLPRAKAGNKIAKSVLAGSRRTVEY